ncbi:MAG TPA: DUF58 domain-containing protein [Gaiellaceae bacterium]|nr:DUF58 domain-containing protein [Gaiellaceae bacterium]
MSEVVRYATPKLGGYVVLTALGLLASLIFGRPELAAVAAPFAVVLAIGLAVSRRPDVRVHVELDRDRVLEDDEVVLEIELDARDSAPRFELLVEVPRGLELVSGANPIALRLGLGDERLLELRFRCTHWGAPRLGDLHVRAGDAAGLLVWEQTLELGTVLRVYPRPEELRELVGPRETQLFTGNRVSRAKGEGLEFADLREFVPGDRIRRINWRASARRGELWVNEFHAERNADVILFLDSFLDARRGDRGTLDDAVRAAATLTERYLLEKDRVGLVNFGGVLNWLRPGTGLVQRYRIVEALLNTEITLSYAWKEIDVLPRGTLPPKALVLALTPLLDDRAIGALLDLRARGFDLVIVEVSPLPYAQTPEGELGELAFRLWKLRREGRRFQYERAGAPVVEWQEGAPLTSVLEGVNASRRHARARA